MKTFLAATPPCGAPGGRVSSGVRVRYNDGEIRQARFEVY
jgi:hypothetical protein